VPHCELQKKAEEGVSRSRGKARVSTISSETGVHRVVNVKVMQSPLAKLTSTWNSCIGTCNSKNAGAEEGSCLTIRSLRTVRNCEERPLSAARANKEMKMKKIRI
jgi:hypothetical protein